MTSVTIGSPDLHIEDPDLIGRRWRMGVLLLIVADGAFVASLIFSYLYLRGLNTERAWLAPHQHTAAIWVSWLISGVMLASALIFRWSQGAVRKGQETTFVFGASLALVVLLAATVIQVIQLVTFKFGIGDSSYSSTVYAMGGANLFHLLLTLFLGAAMVGRGRAHLYGEDVNWQPRIVSTWWTWIAVAALATSFATSFIASPNIGH